jgi:hypothetical protein
MRTKPGGERRQDALQHHRLFEALGSDLVSQKDLRHPAVGELADDAVAKASGHHGGEYMARVRRSSHKRVRRCSAPAAARAIQPK